MHDDDHEPQGTQAQITRPKVGGRTTCTGSVEEVHYFGSIGRPSIESKLPQLEFRNTIAANWNASEERARLWRIVSTVQEVQRLAPAGGGAPLPGGLAAIKSADPAVLSTSFRGITKIRIHASNQGYDDRFFDIDAGESFMCYAKAIRCELVAPAGFGKVGSDVLPLVNPSEMMLDGAVGVGIYGIEQHICCESTFNQWAFVANVGPTLSVVIPRGAKSVDVQQSHATTTDVIFEYGDQRILGAGGVFQISFVTSPTFVEVVPMATHVFMGGDGTLGTFYDLAWTIKP